MTKEMLISYNQLLFHSFCLLYMFRTKLVFHHQEHGIIYYITQFGTIVQASPARLPCTIVPNCVIQYIMPCRRVWLLAARLARTIVPIVLCNTVHYAVLLMMND